MDASTLGQRVVAVRKRVEAALPLDQLLDGDASPGQRIAAARKQVEDTLGQLLEGDGDAASPGQRIAAARKQVEDTLGQLLEGQSHGDDAFAERPEVYVGGAFAGGLALAIVLRALGPK